MQLITTLFAIITLALVLGGCSSEDEQVKRELIHGGFSEPAAGKLSSLDLVPEEVRHLTTARGQGIDENVLVNMVERMHERDTRFVIGTELQLLTAQGMKGETIADLVQMGAIPLWTDDIRALKEARVSDDAVLELAKLQFEQKEQLLGGGELSRLKIFGISDDGLVRFARGGGNTDQLNRVAQDLATGKAEDEALKDAGF